jgi:hypothetical protein
MVSLSDEEMKAILQTVPDNRLREDSFFSDARFVPGRVSLSQTGKVLQPQMFWPRLNGSHLIDTQPCTKERLFT